MNSKHLLITYSWSMNNIGDIGITPGLLNIIGRADKSLPVKVIAWQPESSSDFQNVKDYLPNYKENCEVLPMPFVLEEGSGMKHFQAWRRFEERWGKSKLESFRRGILTSFESQDVVDDILERLSLDIFEELKASRPEAAAAFENAGFVLYNSGTTLNFGRLGVRDLWGYTLPLAMSLIVARRLGIPFGIGSQSFDALDWPMDLLYKKLFADAAFVYCRDSDSLNYLKQRGLTASNSGYRPDTTFFFRGFDEKWADSFMARHNLEEEKFMCILLRISDSVAQYNDPTGGIVSEERKQEHMRKIAQFIEGWIEKTGNKVLICHETRHTIDTVPKYLLPLLPKRLEDKIIYMDGFWTSEQAYSIFKRARIVTSMEMHSIIMALNVGTPSIHNPFDEAGRKKWMMKDIGVADWLLDIDNIDDLTLLDTAISIHENYETSKKRVKDMLPLLETKAMSTIAEVKSKWKNL
ncbi:MAG: hypothetical protein A2020_09445 [Lentisphaerae bacterium GWF2_45_14]|nr:MAG: hypothetical protein A2020_09445 [Lentisphaerae bacterium GWF2_45_14]